MKEIAGQHAITVPIRKDWDSDFFGFPVGAVTLPGSVDAASVVRSVEEWRRSGFRLMYVFAEEPVEADVRSAVEKAGAVAFGSKVVYRKSCVGSTGRVPRTSHAVSTGSAALEDLACASGEHSRFLRDERLRPSFRRLYVKWLEKELANGKVFVSSDAESPEGLATVSLARGADDGRPFGNIGLVAVDSRRRGLGIASRLLEDVDSWLCESGATGCEVATQGDNAPARALYEKAGFRFVSETAVWHFWNMEDSEVVVK